jgi:folylpolyglutamate synthase/dihydropteroate synthase
MADKDVDGIVAALAEARAVRGAQIIATRVELTRALDPAELARVWVRHSPESRPIVEPHVDRALDLALANAPGPVVVAGSLYLVGAARARFVDDPLLRDPIPARG